PRSWRCEMTQETGQGFGIHDLRCDRVHAGKNIALIVVDVEKQFVQSQGQNETIAQNIAAFIPQAKEARIHVVVVHSFANATQLAQVREDQADTLVQKFGNSAFKNTTSPFAAQLAEKGCDLLLFCGFNASACVFDSMEDAKEHGFKTALLEDLTGN